MCSGQKITIEGHVINDIAARAQYMVTLIKLEFLEQGNQVEVVDRHTISPKNICSIEKWGAQCMTPLLCGHCLMICVISRS